MLRTIGFIVGSALAITAMLIVFGMPRLPSSEPVPEQVPAPMPVPLPAPAAAAAAAPVPVPEQEPEQEAAEVEPVATESHWHSFWSPFGSQIAANGFVSRLEAVTGYDFRIVKVETGVYEVAFAYMDEAERLDKISVIASATGLELPES